VPSPPPPPPQAASINTLNAARNAVLRLLCMVHPHIETIY
jgi:hypothetical protein